MALRLHIQHRLYRRLYLHILCFLCVYTCTWIHKHNTWCTTMDTASTGERYDMVHICGYIVGRAIMKLYFYVCFYPLFVAWICKPRSKIFWMLWNSFQVYKAIIMQPIIFLIIKKWDKLYKCNAFTHNKTVNLWFRYWIFNFLVLHTYITSLVVDI